MTNKYTIAHNSDNIRIVGFNLLAVRFNLIRKKNENPNNENFVPKHKKFNLLKHTLMD